MFLDRLCMECLPFVFDHKMMSFRFLVGSTFSSHTSFETDF